MTSHPVGDTCAAISVGVVDSVPCLDLDYSEDANAEVDMNVVMTGAGRFIEVQGTAEGLPFTRRELDELLDLADKGIGELFDLQRELLAAPPPPRQLVTTFVLATANPDKAAEIRAVLLDAGASVDLEPRDPRSPRSRRPAPPSRRTRGSKRSPCARPRARL